MMSGFATTSHSAAAPSAPALAARPYPRLPPVGRTVTPGLRAAASTEPSMQPSVEPLSASTTSYFRRVARCSESRKAPRHSPEE